MQPVQRSLQNKLRVWKLKYAITLTPLFNFRSEIDFIAIKVEFLVFAILEN